jgi:hypothetical protein
VNLLHIFRRFRDAITGRFVSRSYSDQHPDTTVSERVDAAAIAQKFKDGRDA